MNTSESDWMFVCLLGEMCVSVKRSPFFFFWLSLSVSLAFSPAILSLRTLFMFSSLLSWNRIMIVSLVCRANPAGATFHMSVERSELPFVATLGVFRLTSPCLLDVDLSSVLGPFPACHLIQRMHLQTSLLQLCL